MTPCDICSRSPSSRSWPGAAGATKPAAAPRGPAVAARAAELVNYQRNGGLAATLDTVSVRTDGSTRADKRYGGAGRRFDDFRLSAPVMARLRAALGRLPARIPAVGDGLRAGATYLAALSRAHLRGQAGRGTGRPAPGRRHAGRDRRRRRARRPGPPRHAGALVSARAANLLGAHALVVCDRMREAAGMELSSAAVLTALETFADGASIDALRRVLGLSHSGGVRIVKRLEAAGAGRARARSDRPPGDPPAPHGRRRARGAPAARRAPSRRSRRCSPGSASASAPPSSACSSACWRR